MSAPLLMVMFAIVLNVATVVFIRASDGATRFWPCVGVVLTIVPCQLLLAKGTGKAALPIGPTIAVVIAAVLTAATCVGWWYGEKVSSVQLLGLLMALVGGVVAVAAGQSAPVE